MFLLSELPEPNHLIKDQNSSYTFDPIAVSNGVSENNPTGSEIMTVKTFMEYFIKNTVLGNECNGIDGNVLNYNLLYLQENTLVNHTNEIAMDASVESFIEEIKRNHVSLLEATFDYEKDRNKLRQQYT